MTPTCKHEAPMSRAALDVQVVQTPEGIPACSVSIRNYFPELGYPNLLRTAEPANWSMIYPKLFKKTIPMGVDTQGWTRMVEHGSLPPGWDLVQRRTVLKLWKSFKDGGYRIDYDLDTTCDPTLSDHQITVDRGHIWVAPDPRGGVLTHTVKTWAMIGINPWFAAMLVPFCGWTANEEEFFYNAAGFIGDVWPFEISAANL